MKFLLFIFLISLFNSVYAQDRVSFFDMPLEKLLELKVSSIDSIKSIETQKTPSVVKVITKKEIEAMGAITLNEVLETVSGIQLNRGGDNVYTDHIGIRGIYSKQNQQILVLINGQRKKDSIQSTPFHYTRRLIPVHNIEKIEIIKGPGSAIYGADAVSGVINIITSGYKDFNGVKAKSIGGSYDTFMNSVGFSKESSTGGFSFYLHNTQSKLNNESIQYDVQSVYDTVLSSGEISNTPDKLNGDFKESGIEFKYTFKKFSMEFDYIKFDIIPEYGTVGNIYDDHNYMTGVDARLKFKYSDHLNSSTSVGITLGRDVNQQIIDEEILLFEPGTNFGAGAFEDGFLAAPEFTQYEDYLNLDVSFKINSDHSIKLGTGLVYTDIVEIKETKNFSSDLATPRGEVEDVTDTDEVYLPETSRSSIFLYFQDEYNVKKDLNLFTGVRWDSYNDIGETTNPRASVVYTPNEKSTYRLIYAKAFRAPNLYELYSQNNPVNKGNEDLSPEKMESVEINHSYRLSKDHDLSFSIYKFQLRNIINLDANNTYSNIGTYQGEGVEFEYIGEFHKDLKLSFNHTSLKVVDKDHEWAPKLSNNKSFVGINYKISKDWYVSLQQYYFSETTREVGDPREPMPAYGHMNLNLHSPQFLDHYKLMFKIKNVWNEDIKYSSNYININGTTPDRQPSDTSKGRQSFYLSLVAEF